MSNEKPWTVDMSELFRSNRLFDIFPDSKSYPSSLFMVGKECISGNFINSTSRFLIYYVAISIFVRSVFYKKSQNLGMKTYIGIILFIILTAVSLYNNMLGCKSNATHTVVQKTSDTPRGEHLPSHSVGRTQMSPRPLDKNSIYNTPLNNPLGNPLPYSGCNISNGRTDHDKTSDSPAHKTGWRMGVSESELIKLYGTNKHMDGMTIDNKTVRFLKEKENTMLLRTFYKIPVTDCINNQDKFAKSLYGDPAKTIWKQHAINNFVE